MAYAREAAAISKSFDVFPSTEAVLLEAQRRRFRRLHLGDRELQSRSVPARLEQGRSGRARCRRDDPQAVRRQGAGSGRQGAAGAYPRRSGAGAGQAAAGAVRRRPTGPPWSPATTRCAASAWRERGRTPAASMSNISVAVIGGGIGGLTAAIDLLQAGFDVHVYEQTPQPLEVGAGLVISPNASRQLIRLGLGDGAQAHRRAAHRVPPAALAGRPHAGALAARSSRPKRRSARRPMCSTAASSTRC